MLDPRRVLTFREVARLGSFSRAAEALSLTQPAVSQQIAALERQIGEPLLNRGPGGLSLTRAGELLLRHADVVSERLDAGHRPARRAGRRRPAAPARRRVPERGGDVRPRRAGRGHAHGPKLEAEVVEGTTTSSLPACARRPARGGLLPGRRERRGASPGHGARATSTRSRSWRCCALGARAGGPRADPARRARARAVGRRRRATALIGARLPRGRLRRRRSATCSRDPLAIRALVAAGLCVHDRPARAGRRSCAGSPSSRSRTPPRRSVYALLPDAGATVLARGFVAALAEPGVR